MGIQKWKQVQVIFLRPFSCLLSNWFLQSSSYSYTKNSLSIYTVDPWTTWVRTVPVHLYVDFFNSNYCSTKWSIWPQPYLCSFTYHHPPISILCLSLAHTTSTFCMCLHAFAGALFSPPMTLPLTSLADFHVSFRTYLLHDFNLTSIRKQGTSFKISSMEAFIVLFCFVKIGTLAENMLYILEFQF